MPRLASPDASSAIRLSCSADVAAQLERGALADQPEALDLQRVLIQRELDRPVVAGRIVEQLQLQLSTVVSTTR